MGIISKARAAIGRHRKFDPAQAYLEEATSLVDLERRQKEIDTGRFARKNWPF